MRILFVWIVAITLIFTVSLGWYVSQPVVMGVAYGINASITDATGKNISKMVQYASFAWGPLLDIFVLVWALISSGRRDPESEIYG